VSPIVRTRLLISVLTAASVVHLSLPFPVLANSCGDDVGGARVACACGDTVVSDTVLRPGDPVVSGRCPGTGLIVRASEFAETITIDLAGLALVGSGAGIGIDVSAGGSDGAVIVGGASDRRGQIVGFGVGLKVRSPRAARRIQWLELRGQRYEGMNLRSAGIVVADVRATRNGGDGIRISGQGGRLIGIESSENAGAGVRAVSNNLILQARAQGNREHGLIVSGARNDLRGSSALANRGYGVLLAGRDARTEGVVAHDNSLIDIGYRKDRRSR